MWLLGFANNVRSIRTMTPKLKKKRKIKVIFLDIDGVLNSEASCARNRAEHPDMLWIDNPAPEHIKFLNRIIEQTGAEVVISSTWRKGCSGLYMERLLEAYGFRGHVLGSTPNLGDYRGNEIQAWINRRNNGRDWSMSMNGPDEVESFVILDDDSDMLHLKPYLVQTDSQVGLTGDHAEHAIRILNNDLAGERRKVGV